ncbi:MAG: hypothetical protein ACYC3X_20665 [Pirellulaceae bacterium]
MGNFKKVMVEQVGECRQWQRRCFVAELPVNCDPQDVEDELSDLADEAGIDWEDDDVDETEVTETYVSDAGLEDEPDVRYGGEAEDERPLHANSLLDRLSYIATDVESEVGSEAADEFRAWLGRWCHRQPAEAAVNVTQSSPTGNAGE